MAVSWTLLRRILPLQENRESPCRNACLWPKSYARLRNELKAPFLVVTGVMSRRDGAYNLVVEKAKPMYVIPPPARVAAFSLGGGCRWLATGGAAVACDGTG